MKTVTICGSMRFEKEMQKISFELETKHGFNVLQCIYGNAEVSESEKNNIVEAHYKKIDLSDAVYIIDINKYIGNSVKDEIEYAINRGKDVIYHSEFISSINNN